ncbi:hypothetical protein [uncultured Roseibium sp.]|uniref:hypothetical protein n=1 Tax=uncultured Roseibium sp. TaxID=1936171 RepID=UPI00321775D7
MTERNHPAVAGNEVQADGKDRKNSDLHDDFTGEITTEDRVQSQRGKDHRSP